jgi:SPP1 gp7 family putative phage head morphogenesis protein
VAKLTDKDINEITQAVTVLMAMAIVTGYKRGLDDFLVSYSEDDKRIIEAIIRKHSGRLANRLNEQLEEAESEEDAEELIKSYISGAKLSSVLSQAVLFAYGASQLANLGRFERYEYVTMRDDRVRYTHSDLDSLVFKKDDPILKIVAPPNGFRCRCRLVPTTRPATRTNWVGQELSDNAIVLRVDEDFRYLKFSIAI